MAIEEKNKALEFIFTLDKADKEKVTYDIIYDSNDETFPITIKDGDESTGFPLELFVEVVAFLRGKGIMQSSVRGSFGGGVIPMPIIEARDNLIAESDSVAIEAPVIIRDSNVDPLSSFDISKTLNATVPQEEKAQPVGPVVSEGDEVATEEVVKRPVIRSRVKGDDPLSAEQDASNLRRAMKDDSGKGVKRVKK
ncbi:MAG: hypothetical protein ACTSSP_07215 [Candidatus Asgardarchaeia archaeon]